ncbi:hypothetical protein NX783_16415 [Massilia kyonggiensis]|nr:hypothetical protein [Massilia kyonggiensis]
MSVVVIAVSESAWPTRPEIQHSSFPVFTAPQQYRDTREQQQRRCRFRHRREQDRRAIPEIVAAVGHDLAGVVDADRIHEHLDADAVRDGVQVDQVAVDSHERVRKTAAGEARITDHRAGRVDRVGFAEVAAEGTEVVHHAPAVQERMPDGLGADQAVARHLACIVHRLGPAEAAAQRAEILHGAVVVEERVGTVVREARARLGTADDHARVVDAPRRRNRPAQRADVGQRAAAVQERAGVARRIRRIAHDLAARIDGVRDAVAAVQRADGLDAAGAVDEAACRVAGQRGADHGAAVDGGRVSGFAAQRGEEGRHAVFPDECAALEIGIEAAADDAAVVADAVGHEIFGQEGRGVQRIGPRMRAGEKRQQQDEQAMAYRHGRLR